MSNENEKEREHDDALNALHGIGGGGAPDESEAEGEGTHAEPEKEGDDAAEGTPSPAASGFVGMLAKEGAGGAAGSGLDAGAPAGDKKDGAIPRKATTDQIYMAREITPTRPFPTATGAVGGAKRRVAKEAPGWYHAAVPVMYTLGSILLLIGFWAIGALVVMAVSKPAAGGDVWYPFLAWSADIGDEGGFTQGSRIMAWVMVLCLPVSAALWMMARVMQKHIRATEAAEKRD
jgi:hypothetical protein